MEPSSPCKARIINNEDTIPCSNENTPSPKRQIDDPNHTLPLQAEHTIKKRKLLTDEQKKILAKSTIKGEELKNIEYIYANPYTSTFMTSWKIIGKTEKNKIPDHGDLGLEPSIYWKKKALRWTFKESFVTQTCPVDGYTLSIRLNPQEAEDYNNYEDGKSEELQQLSGFYKNLSAKNNTPPLFTRSLKHDDQGCAFVNYTIKEKDGEHLKNVKFYKRNENGSFSPLETPPKSIEPNVSVSVTVTPEKAYKSSTRYGIGYRVNGIIIEDDQPIIKPSHDIANTIEAIEEIEKSK